MSLETLRYGNQRLQVLDQLLLPHKKEYLDVPNVQRAHEVIRNMNIRGAPLIALVAVLGLSVDLNTPNTQAQLNKIVSINGANHGPAVMAFILAKMDYLGTSRPTAVNLFNALAELKAKLQEVLDSSSNGENEHSTRDRFLNAVESYGTFMLHRDTNDCKAIGDHGADRILKNCQKATILTICNTGALACSSYGTALGVVRSLAARDALQQIVALETRPYNQGSRLTSFEIMEEGWNGLLICDSMAAAFLDAHDVDAIVVGADRVCANGDTANKIGTYALSVLAHAHQVPFYVAAPVTTLDASTPSGASIEIEERPADELLASSNAPLTMPVWNPAFDVTPSKYITGIITEKGIIEPQNGSYDIPGFCGDTKPRLAVPSGYVELTTITLPDYLVKHAPAVTAVLKTTQATDLECVEMGDGNLNLVFIVSNKVNGHQVICKQALPYVRCVGESWPLTLERAFFEYSALSAEHKACPDFVPDLYYFNRSLGLICMEYLAPPNIILRKGLIAGVRYPTMARDIGTFCARTFFATSGFALSTTQLRERVVFWSRNTEMCALTEQVVFTEPYMEASNNRWTSPQLDADKKAIEEDVELKVAAAALKVKFLTQTQALIHADLHSGSVMCSPESTYVIDPEFAFYGPMGFDTGAFLANLMLSYVSQSGHANKSDYAEWVLKQIEIFWNTLVEEFKILWDDPSKHTGFKYGRETLATHNACQSEFFAELWKETLGFAGMKMLRRIVGIAHVEDLDSIADDNVRARCERRGLEIAKTFIKTADSIPSVEAAVEIARSTPE